MLNPSCFKFSLTIAAVLLLGLHPLQAQEAANPADPEDATDPESTVIGLMAAFAAGDQEAVTSYFDFSEISDEKQQELRQLFAQNTIDLKKQCELQHICLAAPVIKLTGDPEQLEKGEVLSGVVEIYYKYETPVDIRLKKQGEGWKILPQ